MMVIFEISLLFLLTAIGGQAGHSEAEYDLYFKNTKIGSYHISCLEVGNRREYLSESTSSFRFLGQHTVTQSLRCIFEDGLMTSSEMRSSRNGSPSNYTLTTWKGDHYQINRNGEFYTLYEPVQGSTIQLYFERPPDTLRLYSESEGKMKALFRKEQNVFVLADPGNKRGTEYYYDEKGLKEVEVDFSIMKFRVKRPDPE